MSLTNFPHGITSYGVPIIGGGVARYSGWWGKSFFVDYDHGSDNNTGLEPGDAYKNLQTAITDATINDVIYVKNRDQDITSTDPEYITPESTTNWEIAEAKTHLSIIGASNVSHIPTQEGKIAVYLRGSTTAADDVMEWLGAFGLIENLAFHRGSSTQSILSLTGNSTSLRALGTVVSNCLFRLYSQSTAALYSIDNWFITVYGCEFHDCKYGVKFRGSNSTVRRVRVSRCLFRNQTAASVDINILFSGSSGQDVTVDGCDFVGEIPAAGSNYFVSADAAIQGTVVNCTFPADMVEGTAYINANGLTQVNCGQGKWTADDGIGGLVGS